MSSCYWTNKLITSLHPQWPTSCKRSPKWKFIKEIIAINVVDSNHVGTKDKLGLTRERKMYVRTIRWNSRVEVSPMGLNQTNRNIISFSPLRLVSMSMWPVLNLYRNPFGDRKKWILAMCYLTMSYRVISRAAKSSEAMLYPFYPFFKWIQNLIKKCMPFRRSFNTNDFRLMPSR